jgi:2-polyprenyl-3-methyl-5-hydroxy-6-metoxy-1,4-benzoquinol methylase
VRYGAPVFECRNCRGHRARPIYREVPDRFQGRDGRFNYVACDDCELVQIEEVPDQLGDYYGEYRIHKRDNPIYDLVRKLTLGRAYLQPRGDGGRMLDVGCGNGWYLEQMAKRGWNVVGFEQNAEHAAALSNQLGITVLSDAASLAREAGTFDLITMNFVFEHLATPRPMLELVARCLRPGGQLYVSIPNIDGREARLFKDRWLHLDPPRHISFFSKALIRRVFEELELVDVSIRDLPVPTGFAGSMSYMLWNRFEPMTWFGMMAPGMVFSAVVRDGLFAITGRRPAA